MPPLSLIILKYAASPLPSTPNAEAGPLYGIDWPILISVAVTPGVPPPAGAAAGPPAAEPPAGWFSAFLLHPAISNPKPRSAVIWSADGVCLDMNPPFRAVEATLPHRRGGHRGRRGDSIAGAPAPRRRRAARSGNPRVHRAHSGCYVAG